MRQAEIYATVVIGFVGRVEIKVGKRKFLGVLRSEYPQSLADDGVVLHFLFVLVAEDQDRVRTGGRAFRGARRCRARIGILIALLAPLVVRARIVRRAGILVGRGIIVPPPVGINSAAKIRISQPRAAESKAIVAEAASTDAHSYAGMAAASKRTRCV